MVLLAIGSALAACSGGDGTPAGPMTRQQPPPAIPVPGPTVPPTPVKIVLEQPDGSVDGGATPASPESAPAIAVEQGSRLSLALGGTLAPPAQGQTVTRAMVTLGDIALMRADGRPVTVFGGSFTADVLSLQCALRTIVDGAPMRAGRFPELRFKLAGAWIETLDASKVTHVFASVGEDTKQFGSAENVRPLRIEGVDRDGFVMAGLPRGGLAVQGATSLALHFALNESLSPQGDSWVLSPTVRLVDESSFASLSVSYRFVSPSDGAYLSKGFQSILLDANLLPVCRSALQKVSPTEFVATFRSLEASQGPFVVSLLPPEGTSLQPPVALSIDVTESASASAVIHVTSMRQPSSSSFEIATTGKGAVEQRVGRGQLITRATVPVGDVAEVAPRGHGATHGL